MYSARIRRHCLLFKIIKKKINKTNRSQKYTLMIKIMKKNQFFTSNICEKKSCIDQCKLSHKIEHLL